MSDHDDMSTPSDSNDDFMVMQDEEQEDEDEDEDDTDSEIDEEPLDPMSLWAIFMFFFLDIFFK